MNSPKPLRNPNVVLKDLEDEYLIYSAEHKAMHVLNPTARLIWNLCDGQHSLADIEAELRKAFAIPAGRDVAGDIHATLATFQAKGLLAAGVEEGLA